MRTKEMEGLLIRSVAAVALSAAIAAKAYKRLSLDLSGAILGFLVMAIHIAAGYRSDPSPSPSRFVRFPLFGHSRGRSSPIRARLRPFDHCFLS